MLSVFFIIAVKLLYVGADTHFKEEMIHQWNVIEYEWPSVMAKEQAISDGDFDPKNNTINGIKVYRDAVYVTTPRLKTGVPSTLNVIVENRNSNLTSMDFVLRPFPSWEMQKLGDCSALQLVQSMEIDINTGYMWIVDTGTIPKYRGALSQCEGPMTGSGGKLIPSGSGQGTMPTSLAPPPTLTPLPPSSLSIHGASLQSQPTSVSTRTYDEGQLELLNNEMSFSALYMRDLRTRRLRGMSYESMEDIRARALWQRPDSAQVTPSSGGTTPMPNIQEEESSTDVVDCKPGPSKHV